MEKLKPALYSPLVLAYIGDGVYELYVRSRLIEEHSDMPPHKLHVLSSAHVKAKAQSRAMVIVETILTEEELAIYKRGRNAKSATVPKNADVTEYRRATGFEALIGYLYLKGDTGRLDEIMKLSYEHTKSEEPDRL